MLRLGRWGVETSHLFKLNEIPILTWDVMCHLTLSTINTNTKTAPKLTTTTRLTRRLFLNNKNWRFSGKKSFGTTWLHFLLCYGHFCVIWPFCSLQNMGQCFHLDFFTIFTYFFISDIGPFHTRKTLRLQRKFCFLPS